MTPVQYLRDFVKERLTAAADEIFGVFEKTMVEYEEEIDRQRRLLDMVWKHEIELHRIELPQQHVCMEEEEVLADHQLCIQERNSSLDQEDPEPPQIKEEQEELCTNQEGEQLVLKQETDNFNVTPTHEESDHQLLFYSCHEAESQDQKEGKHGNSRSTRNAEPKQNQRHKSMSQTSFICDTCGKAFKFKSHLKIHLRIHTGEKPYSCKFCEKSFSQVSALNIHTRIHTGEKPYSCKTCEKKFRRNFDLLVHMRRAHTGEKPYLCKICGERCFDASQLAKHVRSHEGK